MSIQSAAESIGAAFRTERKRNNLTQQQLADVAELSDRTVRDIENGTGTAHLSSVLKLADTLGLTVQVTR